MPKSSLVAALLTTLVIGVQPFMFAQQIDPSAQQHWVDSVFNSLSLDERIGQLMMVRANQPNQAYDSRIDQYIRVYNIGGVVFFRNKAQDQLKQTNRWQQMAKTPLFVGIDAEWGLAMRLEGTPSYPLQMTLGAIDNDELIRQMGQQIGLQLRRMGIHISFAPVADVNNNPENPVIGMRSFGETPQQVARKALAYAQGLQQAGIITTAKHFPGHGNTKNDSHYTLPVINQTQQSLNETELYPFKFLIDNGIKGIMTAHLHVPALDSTPGLPSSLSKTIVTQLLRNELGFEGLVVTDGLDMKGVTSAQPPGVIELMALEAGNDILLLPENIPLAISTIRQAVQTGRLPEAVLEDRCKRVLSYKYMAGLNAWRPTSTERLMSDLNRAEYNQLIAELFRQATTLLRNGDSLLPLRATQLKVASIALGQSSASAIDPLLRSQGINITSMHLPKNSSPSERAAIMELLASFDLVLIHIHNTNILANRHFGITPEMVAFVRQASERYRVVLNIFASPYALDLFEPTDKIRSIIIGYQDRAEAHSAVADVITGKINPLGKLPVSLRSGFRAGQGLSLAMSEERPPFKETSLASAKNRELAKPIMATFARRIDSVVEDGINQKAFPGCQIVALKDGMVIFRKSYGKLTYDGDEPVTDSTIYDLASLTKILASTLAFMKLHEQGIIRLTDSLGAYFPWLRKTDKSSITWLEILMHQSGFDGWIPFYINTLQNGLPDSNIYANNLSIDFPWQVAENLYLHRSYRNQIFDQIAASRLKKKEYRYSDLGFYFVPELVKLVTNKEFDLWLESTFYKPMNLKTLTYNPLRKFDKSLIAPTEDDKAFRKQLVRGYVHDQGAAMMGGVSGHAGLFGTAADVAMLMQMMVDGGYYNGVQYLRPETINFFNNAHFSHLGNRRGIGFDKPPLHQNKNEARAIARSASAKSFGHTGFTGTIAWADPENSLVFVFLSNRVYPNAGDNLLAKLGIRPKIHEIIYQAISSQTASLE